MNKEKLIDCLQNAHILAVIDLTETKPQELFVKLKSATEQYLDGIASRDYEEMIISLACQQLFKFYHNKNKGK